MVPPSSIFFIDMPQINILILIQTMPITRKHRDIKYLQRVEVEKIFSKITSVRDKAIFTVMYYRGLRASEVGLLQIKDVRLKDGRIYIRRLKGSISGEYLLSPPEIKVLKNWLEQRGSWLTQTLFPSNRGTPIDRVTLYNLFRRYGEMAGIETDRLFPHTLKHSIATHLLEAGEDLTTVKDWLGHRSITSTEEYGKITSVRRDRDSKRVFEKLK